jgi:hypothetical protein
MTGKTGFVRLAVLLDGSRIDRGVRGKAKVPRDEPKGRNDGGPGFNHYVLPLQTGCNLTHNSAGHKSNLKVY